MKNGKFVARDPCGHYGEHEFYRDGDTIYIGKIGLQGGTYADETYNSFGEQVNQDENWCEGDLSKENPQGG